MAGLARQGNPTGKPALSKCDPHTRRGHVAWGDGGMGQHHQADGPGNGLQVAGSELGGQPVRPVAFAGAWRPQ